MGGLLKRSSNLDSTASERANQPSPALAPHLSRQMSVGATPIVKVIVGRHDGENAAAYSLVQCHVTCALPVSSVGVGLKNLKSLNEVPINAHRSIPYMQYSHNLQQTLQLQCQLTAQTFSEQFLDKWLE
jgi:hypothetical protein